MQNPCMVTRRLLDLSWQSLHNVYKCRITMLYTQNQYNIVRQLHFNKNNVQS